MARMVQCVKFGKEMEGLPRPPFNHDLARRVFDNVSKEAWKLWLEHQKMIINEYKLNLTTSESQTMLMHELEQYFFGEGSKLPDGFVPQQAK